MKIEQFKIEEWMNKYEAIAKINLTTTCISPMSINELIKITNTADIEPIFAQKLGYGNITGSERLKYAIQSLYENQSLKNITVTHGAIGANQLIFLSLLEKDDEVVSIVPTYQQHYSIPNSLGCDVKLYFLKEENHWIPDVSELKNYITPKTKLLCLNNPNNPTGAVIPHCVLKEIVEIAEKNNVWILSDEAYRGLNLIGNPYSPSVADMYDKGISVGTMSKTYSLPGLRVGWVSGRKDLINEINHQRQYNTISVSVIDDYFASLALENKEKIHIRNMSIMKNGFNILKNWLVSNSHFHCVLPNGGTTALLKYNLNKPSKWFCYEFQKRTGVALLPGETMDMEGYVRVGFCADNLQEGLDLLADYAMP